MEIILFIIVFATIIGFEKLFQKSAMGAFFFMATPYLFIIVVNNSLAARFGFYKISTESTLLIGCGFLLFYLGCCIARFVWEKKTKLKLQVTNNIPSMVPQKSTGKISYVNIKAMFYITFAVLLFRLADMSLEFLQSGLAEMAMNDMDSFRMRGPWAHAFLAIYPLMAIQFSYWLKHKEHKKFLFLTVFFIIVAFSSFIKYNIITAVLLLYLYAGIGNKKVLLRGAAIVAALVSGGFILNYFLSFVWRGFRVAESFYLEHLWTYISCGVINTNYVVGSSGLRFDVLDMLISMISSFPRMMVNGIVGTEVISSSNIVIPYYTVSLNGKVGNVVNTFAYVFTGGSIIIFISFCIFWGCISEIFFRMAKYSQNATLKVMGCIYIIFNILSFFAPYAIVSTPWEMLFWTLLVVPLFMRKERKCKSINESIFT